MTMGSSERGSGRSRPDHAARSLHELGRFDVAAVYGTLDDAEASAEAVRGTGVPARRIVVQDRRLTDEGPSKSVVGANSKPAPPTGEPVQTPTRRRDAEVSGVVFSRTVIWTAGAIVLGGGIGFLIGLVLFGMHLGAWIALAVGAAAGSVFGAMAGGIWGAMGQARREEGFLVEVHTDDPDEARRIAEILGRRRPIRLDRTAFDRGLGSV